MTNFLKIAALAGACLAAATAAQATTWLPMSRTSWLAADSIVRVDSGFIHVWSRQDLDQPAADDQRGVIEFLYLNEVDCREQRSRVLQTNGYTDRAMQQIVVQATNPSPWYYDPPGVPVGEDLIKSACAMARAG